MPQPGKGRAWGDQPQPLAPGCSLGMQIVWDNQPMGGVKVQALDKGPCTAGPESRWEAENGGCAGPETHPESLSLAH